jgi:hypothetical protein
MIRKKPVKKQAVKKKAVKKKAVKKYSRRMSGTHTDKKSHNVKINVLSGIDDKLNFNEKVGIIYANMKIVQNKIINREKLTPFEEKLFNYITKYGFHYGSKKAVKDKII